MDMKQWIQKFGSRRFLSSLALIITGAVLMFSKVGETYTPEQAVNEAMNWVDIAQDAIQILAGGVLQLAGGVGFLRSETKLDELRE
jgi:hypothetical protein